MTEPGRYPPPNFSCPIQQPALRPATFQWTPEQQDKFQASRDWNWFQSATAGPWTANFTAHSSSYGNPSYPSYAHNRYSGAHHQENRYGRQGYGGKQWGRKQKKPKEPEFSHFCDTCDRGFKNQDAYDEHIAQHVKCSIADCSFTAHEKVVKIHWKNCHAPGAKRVKLDTPEEIAKWREERRKNYPTLSNVEKKMRIMEVKEQRGDVLETAQFGRIRAPSRGRGGFSRGGGAPDHRGGCHGRQTFHTGSADTTPSRSPPRPPQDGDPLGVLADLDPDSEREDSMKEIKSGVWVAPRNLTSALGSLISSYADDMSVSEEEPDDTPVLKIPLVLEENKTLLASAQNSTPNPVLRTTDHCLQANSQPTHPLGYSGNRRGRGGRRGWGRRGGRGGRGFRSVPQRRHPTLLEMLLAPDIRHERNVVLQCVRHIIQNGFFGLACKDSNTATAETEAITTTGPTPDTAVSVNSTAGETITDAHPLPVMGAPACQTQEGILSPVSHDVLHHEEHGMKHPELCLESSDIPKCYQTNSGSPLDLEHNTKAEFELISANASAQTKVLPLTLNQSVVAEDCCNGMSLTGDQPHKLPEPVAYEEGCRTSSDTAPLGSTSSHQPLTDDEAVVGVAEVTEVNAARISADLWNTNTGTKQDESQQTIGVEFSQQQLSGNQDAPTTEGMTEKEKSTILANEVPHTCPVISMCDDDIWETCTGSSDAI